MPAPKGNQYAKGNKGGGRPTKYKPEYCEQANRMVQLGLTDEEIAEIFDVNEVTLNDWKHEHKEFSQAMKLGKDVADDRVERSLYRAAMGYTKTIKKAIASGKDIKVVEYEEYFPPNVAAINKFLSCRRRDVYADKQQIEHTHNMSAAMNRALDVIEQEIERGRAERAKLVDGTKVVDLVAEPVNQKR